jgi:hypothetical protein
MVNAMQFGGSKQRDNQQQHDAKAQSHGDAPNQKLQHKYEPEEKLWRAAIPWPLRSSSPDMKKAGLGL